MPDPNDILLAKPTPVAPVGKPYSYQPPAPTGKPSDVAGYAVSGGPSVPVAAGGFNVAPAGGIDWDAFAAKYSTTAGAGTPGPVTAMVGAEPPVAPGEEFPERPSPWDALLGADKPAAPTVPTKPAEPVKPPWALDLDKLDPLSRSIVESVIPWLTTGGAMTDAGGLLDTFSTFLTEQYKAKPVLTDASGKPYETLAEFFAPLKDIDVTTFEGEEQYKTESQWRLDQASQWQALSESWRSTYTSGMSTLLAQHSAARRDALDFVNSVLDRQFAAGQAELGRQQATSLAQAGIMSAEKIAKAQDQLARDLSAAGITSTETLAKASDDLAKTLSDKSITSAEKIAAAQNILARELSAAGITSAEKIADAQNALASELSAAGITSAEKISAAGITSAEKLAAAQIAANAANTAATIQADKDLLADKIQGDIDLAEVQYKNALKITNREGELAAERLETELKAQAEEGALNRAIRQGELNEVVRANKALEGYNDRRLTLDREIQQWAVLSSLLKSGGSQLMTMAMANPAEALNYIQPLIASLPPEMQQLVMPQLAGPMSAASRFRGQQAEYGELSIPSASEFAAMSPDEVARYEAAFGTQGQSIYSQVGRLTPGSASGVTRAR